jgi:hypothetical protein
MNRPDQGAIDWTAGWEDDDLPVSETSWFDSLPEPDRWYPVVLEYTQQRVAWVEADDARAAVKYVEDGGCVYEYWDGAEQVDTADLGVVDKYVARWVVDTVLRDREYGPVEACPECGKVAHLVAEYALQYADHAPSCSRHRHHVHYRKVTDDDTGWVLTCSCGRGVLSSSLTSGQVREVVESGLVSIFTRDGLNAAAQAHVAGRPHSKNLTVGITEGLDHPDPRAPHPALEVAR